MPKTMNSTVFITKRTRIGGRRFIRELVAEFSYSDVTSAAEALERAKSGFKWIECQKTKDEDYHYFITVWDYQGRQQ